MNDTEKAEKVHQRNLPTQEIFERLEKVRAELGELKTFAYGGLPWTEHRAIENAYGEVSKVIGVYVKIPVVPVAYTITRAANLPE